MTTVDRTDHPDRIDHRRVTEDLYRDIHKAIRVELFAITSQAGRLDPADHADCEALASHFDDVVWLLESHAAHEDAEIGPVLELHLPDLAERIEVDHRRIDGRLDRIHDLVVTAVEASGARRDSTHRLYLELASFTSDYLEHQDVEERVVMPALEDAVGVEATVAIHHAIVSSIPPDQMARSLALMLPAMNVDDRTELLGGMQAGAPAEVFAGVWSLAGSVLAAADHRALGHRLGIS
jgi:hypothetical protein